MTRAVMVCNTILGFGCLAVYMAARPDPTQLDLAIGVAGVICLLAAAIIHIVEDQ